MLEDIQVPVNKYRSLVEFIIYSNPCLKLQQGLLKKTILKEHDGVSADKGLMLQKRELMGAAL